MQQYLKGKGFDDETISRTVDRLSENKFLNDTEFARMFVESTVRYKPKSKFALAFELNRKGIDSDTIDQVLKDLDDRNLACRAVAKKINQWTGLDHAKRQRKIHNFLGYRGFSHDAVRAALEQYPQTNEE
jgi:regulatory protein